MMPYRPGLTRMRTNGSSSEDFRSVIDDLTVANKKLKQKLRKYEQLYDTHLQDEKLFEVRFHGLPDHKKRELEDTLRKFTAELSDTANGDHPPILHQPPPFDSEKTASSLTSRFAESGYASMSASGRNSVSMPSNQASLQLSAHSNQDNDHRRMTKSQYNRQQQNIHSYLHDIPLSLLPQSHASLSDKAKKKLVVRRLEQVFAGKQSASGNHQQPLQQEEVAQSAAMADRQAKEATGQSYKTEGHREARMVSMTASGDDIAGPSTMESLEKLRPQLNINEQDYAGAVSPDQRPTRPLDLDPYRAQVPVENMQYIRHLGFTPPDMVSGDSPQDGHGWLYLNLIINMAQLHTLNVTPDFVKDAVAEYSSQFELSADGRRIRWRGGYGVSLSGGDSSSEHLSGYSAYGAIAGNKKPTPTHLKTGDSGSSKSTPDPGRKARRIALAQKKDQQSKFAYDPIFIHKEESDEDNSFVDMPSSSKSPFPVQQADNSSGFKSSTMRSFSSKRKRDDGPMIFYNKMKFCTDLTGDRHAHSRHNSGHYKSITTQPLGAIPTLPSSIQQHTFDCGESRRLLDIPNTESGSEEGARTWSSEVELEFSPAALKNDSGNDSPDLMEFEASGLGGVQPDDNFSIRVRRSQTQTTPVGNRTTLHKSRSYPKRILEALSDYSQHAAEGSSSRQHPSIIREEILSTSRKSLPSSTLPPASLLPFDSTSSGDVDSDLDDDSDVSSSPSEASSSESGPAAALHLLNLSPLHAGRSAGNMRGQANESDGEYSEEDEDDDSDDDESIDLLATARKVDPTVIQASEREYDAALADRLAAEIPAGSSAATMGGGSGFNSPMSDDEAEQLSSKARVKKQSTTSGSISSHPKSLKRTRTGDSLATDVQGSKPHKHQKKE
jgi:hypothetical protein